jgi:hypothetical protein
MFTLPMHRSGGVVFKRRYKTQGFRLACVLFVQKRRIEFELKREDGMGLLVHLRVCL